MSVGTSVTNASVTSISTVSLVCTRSGRKVYRVRGSNFEVDDCYSVTSVIGHGSYGIVVSALHEPSGNEVAIKKIGRVFDDLIDGRRIWREVLVLRLLKKFGCRNALRLHRVLEPREPIETFRDLYIVTDLYHTDLYILIRQKPPISISCLRNIAAQTLRCLADMHALGIIHRDIKPNNILLTELEEASVCDFGLARGGITDLEAPLDLTDYVVTRWYRPPELLLMSKYNVSIDVWATGCVMAEFLLQRPLFPGRDYLHQLQLVIASVHISTMDFVTNRTAATFLQECSSKMKDSRPLKTLLQPSAPQDAVDVIEKMLSFDPSVRLTARLALQHDFFQLVGGEGHSKCTEALNQDWSFDNSCEVSEAQLRRALWNEIESSKTS